ncbi:MAG: penicillin-binding protein 2 [Flavobacteriales bacterium]|nr:penicillin-binding protein 2 [Flavobacteriales bacterium]
MNNHLQSRKNIIKGILLTVVIILMSKIFYIQIINSQYKRSAKNNAIRPEVQQAARGVIYDRNGKLIVSNKASKDLMVIPREVVEFDTLRLCELTELSVKDVRTKLKDAKNYSKYIESVFSKQLPSKSALQIEEELNFFKGFYIRVNNSRYYNVDVAAHVIGYIGEVNEKKSNGKYYTKGDLEGKIGVEASYEKQLRGKKGMKMVLVDALNRPQGSFDNGKHDTLAVHGKNITTTLDINLQKYAEQLMQNKKGAIVAIQPSSGEILTLVSSPNYSLEMMQGKERLKQFPNLQADIMNKPLLNRALTEYYPPASNFKLVNGLIALQEGTVNPHSSYLCNFQHEFGDVKMGCHMKHNNTNLNEAIKVSCNVYFSHVWDNLFKNKSKSECYTTWRNHVISFGFGNYLNNDFMIGKKGNIPTVEELDKGYPYGWNSNTLLGMAIGQGKIDVTPIQMANLATIIANRGYYYTPHIIKEIEGIDNIPERFSQINNTSIQPKHFESIIKGMELVLENINGTAYNSRIDNLIICGKTGTSEKKVDGKKKPEHSSFLAFAPKENPQIAIYVIVEDGGYGADWAAPISTLIIEKYLNNTISRTILEKQMITGNLMNKK